MDEQFAGCSIYFNFGCNVEEWLCGRVNDFVDFGGMWCGLEACLGYLGVTFTGFNEIIRIYFDARGFLCITFNLSVHSFLLINILIKRRDIC